MEFEKWDALGNTYLLVQQPDAGVLTVDRVQALCDPKIGIGSDGVLEVVHRDGARAEVVIWNPDGSVAEMSGNGLRIAAAWLAREIGVDQVTVASRERRLSARLVGDGAVELRIGAVAVGDLEKVDVDGEHVELTAVSVGNPHAVIRREVAARDELLRLGPVIEVHPRFPGRTNVQLMRVVDRHTIGVLVWERGAGETASSGSSATAAAAAAVAHGWCDSPVSVLLPGGELSVRLEGGEATLTGQVARMAMGTTDL
jgi:diaminopimelate epimerase